MLQWTREHRYLFEILISLLSDIYPQVGLLGHTVVLFLMLWGTCMFFPVMALPASIPTNSAPGFPFLRVPANICPCLFYQSQPSRCEGISHCGSDFYFRADKWQMSLEIGQSQWLNTRHYSKGVLCDISFTSGNGLVWYYVCIVREETEVQRSWVICPKFHNCKWQSGTSSPGLCDAKARALDHSKIRPHFIFSCFETASFSWN